MNPKVIKKMETISQEIIINLLKFSENEQAFSLDFYISATEPLLHLEDLLDLLRLYLPRRHDLVQMLEKEREQFFHWAHIANETYGSDPESQKTISHAKGKTKGLAQRLVKKIQHVMKIAKEELIGETQAETEQKANIAKPERESWLWKLYEKTLKAFFDSLLGKSGG